MTVAKYVQPNFLTQDHTTYKGSIDAACAVFARHSSWFAPHAQDTPNMTVRVDAGYIWDGVTLTEVAAQNSATIVAPVGNPRIDRVVVDATTGAVSVITGTPAASPSAPALTAGKIPVAKISLLTSSTTITNGMITDERALTTTPPAAFSISGLTADSSPDGTADYLATYDASATANKKVLLNDLLKIVGSLTADSSPDATADYLLSYDASATGPKKVLMSDYYKTINGLTADTSPDVNNDYLVTYDASALAAKKVLPVNLFKGINSLTQDTAADPAADFLMTYDTSAGTVKKVLPNDLGIASAVKLNAQSGAYTLAASDRGKLVNFTGSSSVTWAFTSAATLGDGWWCYLSNSGSSQAEVTLDPNSTEQIDGLTSFKMYPGEVRMVQCTGSAFNSRVINPFYLSLAYAASPFTFTKPPGYLNLGVRLGGGGGGGGRGANAAGGGGGGGGGANELNIPVSLIGTTETVTIGTGGLGATSATTSGADGNNTTFGSLATGFGGAGGIGAATLATALGGGGGGTLGKGIGSVGGSPGGGVAGTSTSVPGTGSGHGGGGGGFGGSTGANIGGAGGDSHFGGGGGSGAYGSSGANCLFSGGSSMWGGGGGNGSAINTQNPAATPGVSKLGGGNGGQGAFDANNASNGTAGSNGGGGGGGGGGEAGNGGTGGNGSAAIWGVV